jgi:hypothetical protein
MQRTDVVMGFATDVRRNAPFLVVLLAIVLTGLALIIALVSLLVRM